MTFMVSWLLAGALVHFIINVVYVDKPIFEIKDPLVRRVVAVVATVTMLPTWIVLLAILHVAELLEGASVGDVWDSLMDNIECLEKDLVVAWNGQ